MFDYDEAMTQDEPWQASKQKKGRKPLASPTAEVGGLPGSAEIILSSRQPLPRPFMLGTRRRERKQPEYGTEEIYQGIARGALAAIGIAGLALIIATAVTIRGCLGNIRTSQTTPKLPATLGGDGYNEARTGYK